MGGLDNFKKLARAAATGLMISGTPVDAAPGRLTKPGSMPREFHDTDRLPPRSDMQREGSKSHQKVQRDEWSDYSGSYDFEQKPATAEDKAALEKWYAANKKKFEGVKTREMAVFQEFVKLMKACGQKRTDIPDDPVLARRILEANEIFDDAKAYHENFMRSWKFWDGDGPDKEILEWEGGIKEYEYTLRFGRSAAEAFEKLMRDFPDTIEYLFDQTFCGTS